jgi:hypothetical protein
MQDTNTSLTRDLLIKDILDAIKVLPKGKAPGHDGISMEFYQELVNEVVPILLSAFMTMLNVRSTSAYINKGLITLIPKSGDRARLGNWRPITLLSSTYKSQNSSREDPTGTHPHHKAQPNRLCGGEKHIRQYLYGAGSFRMGGGERARSRPPLPRFRKGL